MANEIFLVGNIYIVSIYIYDMVVDLKKKYYSKFSERQFSHKWLIILTLNIALELLGKNLIFFKLI